MDKYHKNQPKDRLLTKEQIIAQVKNWNAYKKSKPNNKIPAFSHWAYRNIDKLCDFIENPFCYKSRFKSLLFCQSPFKMLQERQRATLCKVSAILLLHTEAEYKQIGLLKTDGMDGITHQNLRERYKTVFQEVISKGRWDRAIRQLKDCGSLNVDAAFQEEENEDGTAKVIHSIAAMKIFTNTFFSMIGVNHMKDVLLSIQHTIKAAKDKGLNNHWKAYKTLGVLRNQPNGERPHAPLPGYFDDSNLIH